MPEPWDRRRPDTGARRRTTDGWPVVAVTCFDCGAKAPDAHARTCRMFGCEHNWMTMDITERCTTCGLLRDRADVPPLGAAPDAVQR